MRYQQKFGFSNILAAINIKQPHISQSNPTLEGRYILKCKSEIVFEMTKFDEIYILRKLAEFDIILRDLVGGVHEKWFL